MSPKFPIVQATSLVAMLTCLSGHVVVHGQRIPHATRGVVHERSLSMRGGADLAHKSQRTSVDRVYPRYRSHPFFIASTIDCRPF